MDAIPLNFLGNADIAFHGQKWDLRALHVWGLGGDTPKASPRFLILYAALHSGGNCVLVEFLRIMYGRRGIALPVLGGMSTYYCVR